MKEIYGGRLRTRRASDLKAFMSYSIDSTLYAPIKALTAAIWFMHNNTKTLEALIAKQEKLGYYLESIR